MALNAIWPKVQSGDLKAIDRMLAIMARRARYKQLDAPQEIKLTDDELIKKYSDLLTQIGDLEAKVAGSGVGDQETGAAGSTGDAEEA